MDVLLVVLLVLLGAAAIYLLISFGVLGSAGRAGRSQDDASEPGAHEDDGRP